ncbi:hypothetical protein GCK72_021380 [Caenorhabditis remanei]|uniref:F-box domain-containing protein n=1 Tax=Caenorhabditis remanei TaxID=31234 RepID=A0A6A5GJN1_CAERE|nr:hypothetical protein GCK72_021380 [Caenorhabditis remanei]KAF1754816.1 hypothetical protein GCK72_021380 [Caenorhabditis remanei]
MTAYLPNMPARAVSAILDYCNYPEIQALRKTCRFLWLTIDHLLPEAHLSGLLIKTLKPNRIEIIMRFLKNHLLITYNQHEYGCNVTWSDGDDEWENFVSDIDFLTLFFKDFWILLKHQNGILQFFQLKIEVEIPGFCVNMEKVLRSKRNQLKVKDLDLTVSKASQIMCALPYLDPTLRLNMIWIIEPKRNERVLDLEEVVQLPQWKNSVEIEILGFTVCNSIEHFQHFKKAHVNSFELITGQEVLRMNEVIKMTSESGLINLPEDAMRHILEKCDFQAVQSLRKTSPILRGFIAENPPKSVISKLSVGVHDKIIALKVTYKGANSDDDDDDNYQLHVEYQQYKGGCKVHLVKSLTEKTEKIVAGENNLEVFNRDFTSLLGYQGAESLDQLFVDSGEVHTLPEITEKMMKKIAEQLTPALKVKKVNINSSDEEKILKVLDKLEPEHLEELVLESRTITFDVKWKKIGERLKEKFWKNLKVLESAGVLEVRIEELLHLNQLKMKSSVYGMNDITTMKDHFKDSYTNRNKYFSVIYPVGVPYEAHTMRAREMYCTLGDPRLVLLIAFYWGRVDMMFIEPSEVPLGRIVKDW